MKEIRKRLTYANVMSSIAVFLVLGGASALAAGQLGKNSVGSKQLKKNAVTAAKIKKKAVTAAKVKKNAVTAAKIKNGAVTTAKIKGNAVTGEKIAAGSVTGEKVADGSITGADINAPSTPFSQVAARLRTTSGVPAESAQIYPIGSYSQAAGEDDQFLGTLTVNFAAGCAPHRELEAALLIDAPSNFKVEGFSSQYILGIGEVVSEQSGAQTETLTFAPFPIASSATMSLMGPAAQQTHSLEAVIVSSTCETGSGISIGGGAVDVIGTK